MLFFVEASVKVACVALMQYAVENVGEVAKESEDHSGNTNGVSAHVNKGFSQWWVNALPPLGWSVW